MRTTLISLLALYALAYPTTAQDSIPVPRAEATAAAARKLRWHVGRMATLIRRASWAACR